MGFNIKQYNFGTINLTAANLAATYTNHAINGEILRVVYNNTDVDAGSIWLAESGTGKEIWRSNAASGNDFDVMVTHFPRDDTNTAVSGTGGNGVPFVTNAPLYIAGSALGSGNAFTFNVFYR